MARSHFNVLFLCPENSARSIIAEAILNQLGKGRFQAFGAGSAPAATVHPYALEILEREGFAITGLRSKHWDEFTGAAARDIDFVFTLSDSSVGETFPAWQGRPLTADWSIADPLAVAGQEIDQQKAFSSCFHQLYRRINLFINLPLETLDSLSIQHHLDEIGQVSRAQEGGA